MKRAIALSLLLVLAAPAQISPLPTVDLQLSTLFTLVAARQPAGGQMLDWSQATAPTNGVPSLDPISADWDFARLQLATLGARVAVWTFDGPNGKSWALVAEAQLGGRSNLAYRCLFSSGRAEAGLPATWTGRTADLP